MIYDFKNHKTGSESECEPIVDIFGIALKDNDCKQYVRHIMGSEMACLGLWFYRSKMNGTSLALQDQQKRKQQLVCSDHFFTIINYFLSFLDMDLHFL